MIFFAQLPGAFSCAIYADDCTLWLQGRDAALITRRMQRALDTLAEWANMWGFTFTYTIQMQSSLFSRYMNRRELHDVPSLTLLNEIVPYAQNVTFLGVIFDSKLNMVDHVKYVKARAMKRVPLLRCLAGRGCGADRFVLLRIYKSLIRPILEYVCPVLEGPANKMVESLESVPNTCLRIATGALRSTPILPLQVETYTQPLYARRWELTLRYASKVLSYPNHPCRQLVDGSFALPPVDPGYLKRIAGCPIYERLKHLDRMLQWNLPEDMVTKVNRFPSWCRTLVATQKLVTEKKGIMHRTQVLRAFNEFKQSHGDFQLVFTDGSKTTRGVGAAFVHNNVRRCMKMNGCHSIFTAETVGLLRAVQYVRREGFPKSVICTDSMSAVLALQAVDSMHPLIVDIQDAYHELAEDDIVRIMLWVPGHRGIYGNELADASARDLSFCGV